MKRGLVETALAEKFRGLKKPELLGTTDLAIRVPDEMTLLEGEAGGPDRALLKQPKPLADAGIETAFYGWLRNERGPTPVYQLLFGFRSISDAAAADPKAEILEAARRPFPNNPESINWQEVQVTTPTGAVAVWDKLRIESRFEYVMYDVPKTAFAEIMYFDGAVEVYLRHFEGVGVVWIVWRVPAPIANEIRLETKTAQVAGSVMPVPK